MPGYLYLLQSPNCKRPYLGSTQDAENRLQEHNNGQTTSTRNKEPWILCKTWIFSSLLEARRIERKLKQAKIKLLVESIDNF